MATITSGNNAEFLSHHPKSGWRSHFCVAWSIEDGKVTPILFPDPPRGSRVFLCEGMSSIRDIKSDELFGDKSSVEAVSK